MANRGQRCQFKIRGKCRLLENIEDFSSYQIDEISSGAPKNREQAKNNFGVCKTHEAATKTKNAASTGMEHGVKSDGKASALQASDTTNRRGQAMSKLASPEVKAVARTVGYALTLDDFDGWSAAASVFASRLSDTQGAGLAWAAMRAIDPAQAEQVAEAVLGGAGMPVTLLGGILAQATFWADRASPVEREAYCLATFKTLPAPRRAAFLAHVQGSART